MSKEFNYYYGEYSYGGTYIAAYKDDDLYADVTICLVQYGIIPVENQIIIPLNDIEPADFMKFKSDLVKEIIKPISYGPYEAKGLLVELKDEWKNICHKIEEY